MRRFHVIGLTADLSQTLAVITAAGWMLPWFDDNPHVPLSVQVEGVLRRSVSDYELLHESPVRPDMLSDIVSGSYVSLISGSHISDESALVSNTSLHATPPLIAMQKQAWLEAVERLRTPIAPFDSSAGVSEALEWARQKISIHTGASDVSVFRHRCTRHEYVVRLDTTAGTFYLKAGKERAYDEGALTALLWNLRPRMFPETLALDRGGHRWLYRELSGSLLMPPRLTTSNAELAVRTLASLQQQVAHIEDVRMHLSGRQVNAIELLQRATTIVEATWSSLASSEDDTMVRWHEALPRMTTDCQAIENLQLPLSLVLSDFWPRNIVATESGIGFIDLENSYWGYPFLSLFRFLHAIRRLMPADEAVSLALQQAFIDAWSQTVIPVQMRQGLQYFPLLGRLFEILLAVRELELDELNLGRVLPRGYYVRTLAPRVRELLAHVAGDSATVDRNIHVVR